MSTRSVHAAERNAGGTVSSGEAGPRTSLDQLNLSSFPMRELLLGCIDNLQQTFRPRDGLFPYATRWVGGRLVSDYDHPQSIRYTINSLLGLNEAARSGVGSVTPAEVTQMTGTFLAQQLHRIERPADLGLLTLLVSEYGDANRIMDDAIVRLDRAVSTHGGRRLDIQDLSWAIWGSAAAARHGVRGAEEAAIRAANIVRRAYVEQRSSFPRHSTRAYRRNIVSFGGLTYYLRAMHELETTFGEGEWVEALRQGVERALRLQGPQGEWPWMIDVRTGTSFDAYPIFSVHQDSMAMLFLLPALDRGIPGAALAIERSLAWGFGANELGTPFYTTSPFHAYRSIERAERVQRLRRYARGVAHALQRRPARFAEARVRLNRECRSYHLGWVLYVWAQRLGAAPDTPTGRNAEPEAD